MKGTRTKSRFLKSGRLYRAVRVKTGTKIHVARDADRLTLCKRMAVSTISVDAQQKLEDSVTCSRCRSRVEI